MDINPPVRIYYRFEVEGLEKSKEDYIEITGTSCHQGWRRLLVMAGELIGRNIADKLFPIEETIREKINGH